MASRRRKHVQLFAARLAHLLNASDAADGDVQLNYGVLYDQILRLLGGHPQIRDDVVGATLFPDGTAAEDAAGLYFDRVLDRPMGLAPGKKSSVVYDLLAALLQRGASNVVKGAELHIADSGAAVSEDTVPLDLSLRHVKAELARLRGAEPADPGETRPQPYLRIGNIVLGLPPALSIWDSVVVSPPLIAPIKAREPFLAFCARVINAIETANRHYFELLNLGLYPPDWIDEVPVNQVRAVGRLCRKAQELADEPQYAAIDREVWRAAWNSEAVPTFADADAFLDSPMGRALLAPTRPRFAPVEDDMLPAAPDADDGAEIMDKESFARMLTLCRENGVIDAYDAELMQRIFDGETIETLKSDPMFQTRVGKQRAKIDRYIAGLSARLVTFAERQNT